MASLPRSVRTTVVTALCCAIFVLLGAPAALAHDRLKSSSPAKDAKVSAVERIRLEFSSQVRFPAVALRTASDTIIDIGKAKVAGDTVTSDVSAPLDPGDYVIAWRVVSSDGHPIEGETPFIVTAPATPSAKAAPTVATTPVPEPTASASAPVVAQPVSPGPASATGEQENAGSLPGWIWVALAAIVAIGAGIWLQASRRGRSGGAE
ncbi:copper resistance protein CopC [Streptosporangium sp. NPDC049046]|uniref:copper resistance CopC family protein n=1 Tax=unclassified Streptosporangium TaxID=2632669 RepID=UPI00341B3F5A